MSDLLAVFAAFIMVFIFIALVFYVIGGLVYMSLGKKPVFRTLGLYGFLLEAGMFKQA